jgi:hypothetical protein
MRDNVHTSTLVKFGQNHQFMFKLSRRQMRGCTYLVSVSDAVEDDRDDVCAPQIRLTHGARAGRDALAVEGQGDLGRLIHRPRDLRPRSTTTGLLVTEYSRSDQET